MRGLKKQKSRAMVVVCTLIRGFLKERRQQAAGFWKANDVWTHIGWTCSGTSGVLRSAVSPTRYRKNMSKQISTQFEPRSVSRQESLALDIWDTATSTWSKSFLKEGEVAPFPAIGGRVRMKRNAGSWP